MVGGNETAMSSHIIVKGKRVWTSMDLITIIINPKKAWTSKMVRLMGPQPNKKALHAVPQRQVAALSRRRKREISQREFKAREYALVSPLLAKIGEETLVPLTPCFRRIKVCLQVMIPARIVVHNLGGDERDVNNRNLRSHLAFEYVVLYFELSAREVESGQTWDSAIK